MDGLDGLVGLDGVVGLNGVVGIVWVLKTKSSRQEEEQEQLNPLLDHGAARQLVKKRNSFIDMT